MDEKYRAMILEINTKHKKPSKQPGVRYRSVILGMRADGYSVPKIETALREVGIQITVKSLYKIKGDKAMSNLTSDTSDKKEDEVSNASSSDNEQSKMERLQTTPSDIATSDKKEDEVNNALSSDNEQSKMERLQTTSDKKEDEVNNALSSDNEQSEMERLQTTPSDIVTSDKKEDEVNNALSSDNEQSEMERLQTTPSDTATQPSLENVLNSIVTHLKNIKILEDEIERLKLEVAKRDEIILERDDIIAKYKLQLGSRNPSGRPSLISDEQRSKMLELRAMKYSYAKIANETGVSYQSVSKFLNKNSAKNS